MPLPTLSIVRLWCLFLGLLVLRGSMVQGEFGREGMSVVVSVLSRGEYKLNVEKS